MSAASGPRRAFRDAVPAASPASRPRRRQTAPGGDVEPVPRQPRRQLVATPPVPPIRCRGLTKQFGEVTVVDRLDVTIRPGRITGLVGLPGAGMTTVLRMLLGLVRPTSGTATFGRTPYARLRHPQRTVGGVLEPRFHPRRTGRNHLRVLAVTAGESDRRVDEMLALVGLSEAARCRVGTYTAEMRQRLALAGALLGDPSYLLLDEPTAGLSRSDRRWLVDFLRSFADTGRTVLLATSHLSELSDLVDDVVVLARGRLVRHGSLAELERANRAVVVRSSSPERARAVVAELGLEHEAGHDVDGPYLRVRGELPETIGAALYLRNVSVFELRREPFELAGIVSASDLSRNGRAA